MTRASKLALVGLLVAGGCASRSEAPTRAAPATRALDPAAEYLANARATFTRASRESPVDAARTLSAFGAVEAPVELAASDRTFVRIAVDRELALRALDAGDDAGAVVAIERALAASEGATPRDAAHDAALLLVAEEVYRRAARSDAASWARREAEVLVGRDGARQ